MDYNISKKNYYNRINHPHFVVSFNYCEHGKSILVNPLSPNDALKHHFTSLKTNLIFLQLKVLE